MEHDRILSFLRWRRKRAGPGEGLPPDVSDPLGMAAIVSAIPADPRIRLSEARLVLCAARSLVGLEPELLVHPGLGMPELLQAATAGGLGCRRGGTRPPGTGIRGTSTNDVRRSESGHQKLRVTRGQLAVRERHDHRGPERLPHANTAGTRGGTATL